MCFVDFEEYTTGLTAAVTLRRTWMGAVLSTYLTLQSSPSIGWRKIAAHTATVKMPTSNPKIPATTTSISTTSTSSPPTG